MRTRLRKKGVAILSEVRGEIFAIIECDVDEEINPKLRDAILDEFVLDSDTEIVFDSDDKVLTDFDKVPFSVKYNDIDDGGEESMRDFEIKVVVVY